MITNILLLGGWVAVLVVSCKGSIFFLDKIGLLGEKEKREQ